MLGRGDSVKNTAAKFGISPATVYRKLARYKETGQVDRKKSIRSKKISESKLREIKTYVNNDPFATLREIKCDLNLNTTSRTVSNYLRELKLPVGVSPKKFLIKPIDCELRLESAIRRRFWSLETWKKIVFTDESGIDNSGFHRRLVRRPRGSRFDRAYIYRAPNQTLRLNFFSWVSKFGTGEITFYAKMDKFMYCQVISTMIEKLKELFESEDFKIVHDNAAFATCFHTEEYMRKNDLCKFFVKIPAYSPDMNIIENLWAVLKRRVKEITFREGRIDGREHFKCIVEREWQNISSEICDNLYKSLPERMKTIVSASGELTRF